MFKTSQQSPPPIASGEKIYSAEPGNRPREGKYLLHEMRNLLRHTCYAQVLISQPLSSSSALRIHTFRTLAKNSETFVLLMYTITYYIILYYTILHQQDKSLGVFR